MEELDLRGQKVLKAIIQEHIATGEPVGSRTLSERPELPLSSATLRSVMGDLEALGLLHKPHTSAGRVPTEKGYRYYVDALVKLREPAPGEKDAIEGDLARQRDPGALPHDVSRLLAGLTHHAGLVAVPREATGTYRHIEFVRLREDRVLAILVTQAGLVQNRLITVDFPVSQADLERASRYLDELLQATPLDKLAARIRAQMREERAQADALSRTALRLGAEAVAEVEGERKRELVVEGAGTLLEEPALADLDKLRQLFRALEEKEKILKILDRAVQAGRVSIFIGAETELGKQGEVAIVASPYGQGGTVLGTLGVIGPMRMNYAKVIPVVQYTARVLSRVLEESLDPGPRGS